METRSFFFLALLCATTRARQAAMPPLFKEDGPTFYDVPVGERVKLRCAAVGKPRPVLFWYLNGTVLSREADRLHMVRNSLVLLNVTPSDAGFYACNALNKHGSIWKNFTVSVNELPWFKENGPTFYDVPVGKRVKLRCAAVGEPRPVLFWYLNGTVLSREADRLRMVRNSLVLLNVTLSDAGFYACNALNKHGSIWKNFTVSVNVKPSFTKKMKHLIAKPAGNPVTLTCDASGYPPPTTTWLKNKMQPKRRDGKEIHFKKSSIFMDELGKSDTGDYTCIVSNDQGSINWTYRLEVTETVDHVPIFEEGYPSNQTVSVGGTAVFECKFMSSFQATIYWYRHISVNGSDSKYGSKYVADIERRNLSVSDPRILVINNVTTEDEGWYTCKVGNLRGFTKKTVWLEVLTVCAHTVEH